MMDEPLKHVAPPAEGQARLPLKVATTATQPPEQEDDGGRTDVALRLTRIILENWKNFRKVDVSLANRVFIIGPNAAGKSNLLDAIRFLRDIVSPQGGGFQSAVSGRSGGIKHIRSLHARQYSDIRIKVHVGTDELPDLWQYDLSFSQDNQRRPIVKAEQLVYADQRIFNRPDDADKADPEQMTQTHLQQVTLNKPARPLVSFLRSIGYLHIVPQLIRDPDRSAGLKDDPYGGDFLARIAATPVKIRNARLVRVRDALRKAVPQLSELEVVQDEATGTPHLQARFEHWRPRGALQREDQFSDGTLRLIGLLWALQDGSGPLLLEEPELSLHSEAVQTIPALFLAARARPRRQIVVSSHSPDLLRDEGIGLDEVLVIESGADGSEVKRALDYPEVVGLVRHGTPLSEAVGPRTAPPGIRQLRLVEF
jgi:predicted ATPase